MNLAYEKTLLAGGFKKEVLNGGFAVFTRPLSPTVRENIHELEKLPPMKY